MISTAAYQRDYRGEGERKADHQGTEDPGDAMPYTPLLHELGHSPFQTGFRGAACAQFGASLPGRGPVFNVPIRSAEADRVDVDPSALRQLTPTTALPILFENFRRR
jgi:hypothetical protein